MLFAELALAAKIFEGALQFVSECFKHWFWRILSAFSVVYPHWGE
jgi:hypothetical protein